MDSNTSVTGPSKSVTQFSELGLCETALKGVDSQGYTEPTAVQAQAIPLILQGKDLIAGSQTGTGKTAAFALPILSLLKKHGACRCLMLEPTRELAAQVRDAFVAYGKFFDIEVSLIHGGVGYGRQLDELKSGVDIIVATPGRLLDHLEQKAVNLKKIDFLVLDEVDRMLDMGFLPDVRRIIRQCSLKRQSLLFSATVPSEIKRLAKWVLHEPEHVNIGGGFSTAETINHTLYPVDDRQKFDLLLALLEKTDFHSVLIFSRTKAGAEIIARWLNAANHSVVSLHSDRSQKERDNALQGFKSGKYEVLVATDIVARGIDISTVSHVINYDIPQNPEDYVHRIGRTGRANNEGDAMTIYCPGEQDFLRAIERFIEQEIPKVKIEGFDYNYTPFLEEKKNLPKRRNRGYNSTKKIPGNRRR